MPEKMLADSNRLCIVDLKLMLQVFFLCAEHGTNLAGVSPATGIYRQV